MFWGVWGGEAECNYFLRVLTPPKKKFGVGVGKTGLSGLHPFQVLAVGGWGGRVGLAGP